MKRTTITLPDDVAVVLEREARRRGLSSSEVAREALREHLGLSERPKRLPFVGLGRSGRMTTAENFEEELARERDRDRDR